MNERERDSCTKYVHGITAGLKVNKTVYREIINYDFEVDFDYCE